MAKTPKTPVWTPKPGHPALTEEQVSAARFYAARDLQNSPLRVRTGRDLADFIGGAPLLRNAKVVAALKTEYDAWRAKLGAGKTTGIEDSSMTTPKRPKRLTQRELAALRQVDPARAHEHPIVTSGRVPVRTIGSYAEQARIERLEREALDTRDKILSRGLPSPQTIRRQLAPGDDGRRPRSLEPLRGYLAKHGTSPEEIERLERKAVATRDKILEKGGPPTRRRSR